MLQFGALSRKEGGWFSCNGARFYDCTIIALLSKQLAIYSINKNIPGGKFIRLNDAGLQLAQAIVRERDARIAAQKAAAHMEAEIANLTPARQEQVTEFLIEIVEE